jgi:hypothetical protein
MSRRFVVAESILNENRRGQRPYSVTTEEEEEEEEE